MPIPGLNEHSYKSQQWGRYSLFKSFNGSRQSVGLKSSPRQAAFSDPKPLCLETTALHLLIPLQLHLMATEDPLTFTMCQRVSTSQGAARHTGLNDCWCLLYCGADCCHNSGETCVCIGVAHNFVYNVLLHFTGLFISWCWTGWEAFLIIQSVPALWSVQHIHIL